MLSFNLEYYFLQLYKAETDFKWSFAFCRSWLLLRELLLVPQSKTFKLRISYTIKPQANANLH